MKWDSGCLASKTHSLGSSLHETADSRDRMVRAVIRLTLVINFCLQSCTSNKAYG